ncbi:MAG: DNA segregation ATPase FtsK/SpoIIIE, S-DNA-T family [Candidatus Berkelbacteria bacterium Athens1014_28]|uniref:DNA segregation ATPase FtsK/SpoIIIE, S-DNA-T family n=1 Tax=Candidatus Berkelbacteria bacterium Athens1014_28 TaxID=2017145 RepID=A0A554LM54_9BACT|nr:MAG: DNA segregation ATPase FtsK/SpoIIIE, S-DNA-T family [Candidatus Berkelbacteria bacterium Athens1014_28]
MGRKRKYPKHKQRSPKWFQRENEWGDYVFDWTLGLGPDTWREIFGIIFMVVAVVLFLGIFGSAGRLGEKLRLLDYKFLGMVAGYILPLAIFWLGAIILFPPKGGVRVIKFFGIALFFLFVPAMFHLFIPEVDAKGASENGDGGGVVGYLVSNAFRQAIGTFPSFLVTFVLSFVSIMMVFDLSISSILGRKPIKDLEKIDDGKVKIHRGGREEELPERPKGGFFAGIRNRLNFFPFKPRITEDLRAPVIETTPLPSTKISSGRVWQFPTLDLLVESNDVAKSGDIGKNVETIKKCFSTLPPVILILPWHWRQKVCESRRRSRGKVPLVLKCQMLSRQK